MNSAKPTRSSADRAEGFVLLGHFILYFVLSVTATLTLLFDPLANPITVLIALMFCSLVRVGVFYYSPFSIPVLPLRFGDRKMCLRAFWRGILYGLLDLLQLCLILVLISSLTSIWIVSALVFLWLLYANVIPHILLSILFSRRKHQE